MDPDANLKEQLELARSLTSGDVDDDDGIRLAELVEALDAWIRGGGFLPRAWRGQP